MKAKALFELLVVGGALMGVRCGDGTLAAGSRGGENNPGTAQVSQSNDGGTDDGGSENLGTGGGGGGVQGW